MQDIPVLRPIIIVPEGHVAVTIEAVHSALLTLSCYYEVQKSRAKKFDLQGQPHRAGTCREKATQIKATADRLRLEYEYDRARQVQDRLDEVDA